MATEAGSGLGSTCVTRTACRARSGVHQSSAETAASSPSRCAPPAGPPSKTMLRNQRRSCTASSVKPLGVHTAVPQPRARTRSRPQLRAGDETADADDDEVVCRGCWQASKMARHARWSSGQPCPVRSEQSMMKSSELITPTESHVGKANALPRAERVDGSVCRRGTTRASPRRVGHTHRRAAPSRNEEGGNVTGPGLRYYHIQTPHLGPTPEGAARTPSARRRLRRHRRCRRHR